MKGHTVVTVEAEITRHALMEALRELTVNNEDFNHRLWAIWDAEVFESAARMIRDGYRDERKSPPG